MKTNDSFWKRALLGVCAAATILSVSGLAAGCASKDVSTYADDDRQRECRFLTDPKDYMLCLKYGKEPWPDASP